MEYKISDRVQTLKPSAIREIFKYAADPTVVSLSAGNPAPEAFPVKEVAEISARIMAERPVDVLQYGLTEGYLPLRQHLTAYMKEKHQVGRDFDDILITSGAQQVMDLTTKSLCNEGDVVICEAPSFIGSLNTFRSYNARLRGVPMESDGMDMNELERALKEEPRAKFIYTIPNFQNPSGITMSLEKRKQLYALAKQYGVMILEDNPYGDLRFRGEALPPIKSLDETGHVIYMGSFSKILAPGVRTGYVLAHRDLIAQYTTLKSACDVHSNILAQKICYRFLTEQDMDAHLAGLAAVYRRKSTLMLDAFDRCFDSRVTRTEPDGGLFVWCILPEGCDSQPFAASAAEAGVLVVPGAGFMTDPETISRSFRLNYSTPSDEAILRGMEILGRLTHSL